MSRQAGRQDLHVSPSAASKQEQQERISIKKRKKKNNALPAKGAGEPTSTMSRQTDGRSKSVNSRGGGSSRRQQVSHAKQTESGLVNSR